MKTCPILTFLGSLERPDSGLSNKPTNVRIGHVFIELRILISIRIESNLNSIRFEFEKSLIQFDSIRIRIEKSSIQFDSIRIRIEKSSIQFDSNQPQFDSIRIDSIRLRALLK